MRRADLLELDVDSRPARLGAYLQAQFARVLRVAVDEIALDQPANSFALDSLMAVELQHTIETDLAADAPMVSFLGELSISQLAEQLLSQIEATPPRELHAARAGRADVDGHALSAGQRALWFLQQLDPQNAAYNIASAVRVRGALDVAALRRAFERLIERHPALRSVVVAPDGQPRRQINTPGTLAFHVTDATRWNAARLDEYLRAEAFRPFDLEQGPLFKVHLLQRAEDEPILLLVVHHIVADLWSIAILLHELGLFYTAERSGVPAPLTPPAQQYDDYVAYQSELLATQGEELAAYWQQKLSGELPPLELPADRPRPAVRTFRGAVERFTLDAALTHRLKGLARANGTTLYTALLATFQVLLHRYSGQDDVLVGSPTAGRSRAEFAGLVGYFVNPVVLRADLSGNPTFTRFLSATRTTVLEALQHQEYPFARLVERLQAGRDPRRSPVFQALFALQRAQAGADAGLTALALGVDGARVQAGELVSRSDPPGAAYSAVRPVPDHGRVARRSGRFVRI